VVISPQWRKAPSPGEEFNNPIFLGVIARRVSQTFEKLFLIQLRMIVILLRIPDILVPEFAGRLADRELLTAFRLGDLSEPMTRGRSAISGITAPDSSTNTIPSFGLRKPTFSSHGTSVPTLS